MKTYILLIFMFICFIDTSIGQLDTFKKNEVRFSLIGNSLFLNNVDNRVISSDRYLDPTFTYLRQLSETKYFLKADLSGSYNPRYSTLVARPGLDGFNSNQGLLQYFNVYLGAERQMKFEHWGLFIGIGGRGGMINYKSNISFQNKVIEDFKNDQQYLGIAGQLTAYTNFTDKVYFFLTSTMYTHYIDIRYSRKISNECCEDYKGWDTNLHILDAFGIGVKF